MRTCCLLIATILIFTYTNAQPGPAGQGLQNDMHSQEKLMDRLLRQPNAMLKQDISDIGELKNVKVQLVKISNMSNADMQFKVVRFAYAYNDINTPAVKAVYLDMGGIDEIAHNFITLQSKLLSQKSDTYSETMFKTRDGIIGGCYWAKDGWAPYLKLADTDDSYIVLGKDDLNKLVTMLDEVKSKLKPDAAKKK